MSKKQNQSRSTDNRGRGRHDDRSRPNGASECSATEPKNPYAAPAICGFLLLAVVLVFGRTAQYGFVSYDDDAYVHKNPHVAAGLSVQGIVWAFTSSHSSNWHPLTWLSHELDCQLYDLRPCGHHLGNVALHAATAILVFLVLRRMTGRLWPSAFVATVFAVHPLRVESVAWVAERKDVLSGLFFMLTLWAYTRYVERPASWGRYMAVLAFFALGLMAKPMLVTVPFVLLLLDYWPLGRMGSPRSKSLMRLVIEKIPLLLLAGASCVVTIVAQAGAIQSLEFVPLPWRIANALVSYVAYLRQFVYPVGLAVFYPHPGDNLPIWQAVVALLVLVCISLAVLAGRRKRPYLLVGWLWYLGMLVPVIGLVQVGWQAMADRYTYLAQIGVGVALAWGIADAAGSWPRRRWLLPVSSSVVIVILMGCAWRQTGFWRNSESLWAHTVACNSNNTVAHNNLGAALEERGLVDEAIAHYREAMKIDPNKPRAYVNLGAALEKRGLIDDAIAHYRQAVTIEPDNADAHYNLGVALEKRGLTDEAMDHYRKALDINPDFARAHINLGAALARRGLIDEAMEHYRKALDVNPDFAEAHNNLGAALLVRGLIDEATDHFQEALKIHPDYPGARQNLSIARSGRQRLLNVLAEQRDLLQSRPDDVALLNETAWLLATNPNESIRNGTEAVKLAQRAASLSGTRRPAILGTLAAAYAETGQFTNAVKVAQKAIDLASADSNAALVDALREQIKLYQAGSPCRQMQHPADPKRAPIAPTGS